MPSLCSLVRSQHDVALVQEAAVRATETEKNQALDWAVSMRKEEMVRVLLKHGAYANAVDTHASFHGRSAPDVDNVRALDDAHPDRQADFPPFVRRVLHRAYEDRHIPIMKLLLEAGANLLMTYINSHQTRTDIVQEVLRKDDLEMLYFITAEGWRQFAVSNKKKVAPFPAKYLGTLMNTSLARQHRPPDPDRLHTYVTADDANGLLQHAEKANQYEKDKALAHAVYRRNASMVLNLLQHKAYADSARLQSVYDYPDAHNKTLQEHDRATLENEVHRVIHEAYEKRDVEILGLLVIAGANLQRYYPISRTDPAPVTLPLHMVRKGDREMLKFLLALGWDINQRAPSHDRDTPLTHACKHNLHDMMEFLIGKGANVDVQYGVHDDKQTMVHRCIRQGDRHGLRILMENDVDINVYNVTLKSALAYAIDVYLHHTGPETVVHQDPMDPDDMDDQEDAIKCRRGIIKDILKYNVDFGLPVQLVIPGAVGSTPLPLVPHTIQALVMEYRVRQGLDYLRTLVVGDESARFPHHVDFQDEWGKTALHRAVENGDFDAVKTLVDMGARDDLLDRWGRDPFQLVQVRFLDQHRKLSSEGFFHLEGSKYRYQQGDALLKDKLQVFSEIKQYMVEKRNGGGGGGGGILSS